MFSKGNVQPGPYTELIGPKLILNQTRNRIEKLTSRGRNRIEENYQKYPIISKAYFFDSIAIHGSFI